MKRILLTIIIALAFLFGSPMKPSLQAKPAENDSTLAVATFAGGCFWCMEPPFQKLDGVKDVISGYTGGTKKNPTYQEVSAGATGHREAVEIVYDPAVVDYQTLLKTFWQNIDPTDRGGQFADRGSQYHTAIFYHGDEQRRQAEKSREILGKSGKFDRPIATEILPASEFYRAEDYHQDYYKKNPLRYNAYKAGSGREGFIEKFWHADSTFKAER
ncbi:MAG: peptide-methionine (S)-S-oxide reductase MsrA [bacterium]